MSSHSLAVPGATLHYERSGTGPVLLMFGGGPVDADTFAPLAAELEDAFTVVRHDPRGNSRSKLKGEPVAQQVQTHADDARRVLEAITDEPAYVLAQSGGGLVGLELAAAHAEQVAVLVAHEPTVFELLSDRAHWRAVFQDVERAYA